MATVDRVILEPVRGQCIAKLDVRGALQAAAFVAWVVAALPIVVRAWHILRAGTERLEEQPGGAKAQPISII